MLALPERWERVYAVVKRIPRGKVATYGDVAWVTGWPRGARLVGQALGALRGTKHAVPWQRVLGARGLRHAGVSILDPMGAAVQRALLEREGVAFDVRGRVELARFGWRRRPSSRMPTPRPGPASPSRSPRRTAGSSGRRRRSPSEPR